MLSLSNIYTLYFRLYISTMYLLKILSINNNNKNIIIYWYYSILMHKYIYSVRNSSIRYNVTLNEKHPV